VRRVVEGLDLGGKLRDVARRRGGVRGELDGMDLVLKRLYLGLELGQVRGRFRGVNCQAGFDGAFKPAS
jgi:hypothetical protein